MKNMQNKMLPPSLSPAALTAKEMHTQAANRQKNEMYSSQMNGMIPMNQKRPNNNLSGRNNEQGHRELDREAQGGLMSSRSSLHTAGEIIERQRETSGPRSAVMELGHSSSNPLIVQKPALSTLSDQ